VNVDIPLTLVKYAMYSSLSDGKVSDDMRGNKRKSKAEKSRGEVILAETFPDRSSMLSRRP
jgi:hypothetical protein